jgi:hypothetical protein
MRKPAGFLLMFVILLVLLSACVPAKVTKKDAFPEMYNERPLSILVLPPINVTTAADAKEYYLTTVAEPISYAGYYIFPIEVTSDILKSVGLPDTEIISQVHLQKFKEFFGADAVLFVKIVKWDTSYAVIAANVAVGIECVLKSTTTFKNLWQYDGVVVVDTSGGSGGGGLIGLAVKAVITAIATATTDYVPIARRVNHMVIGSVPYGKYHPGFDTDREVEILQRKVITSK